MIDRRADLSFALVVAVLGVLVTIASQFIRLGAISDPIGPRGLPSVIGVFLLLAGVSLAILRLRAWSPAVGNLVPTEGREDDEPGTESSFGRVAVIVGICVAYAIAVGPIGFILSTTLLMGGLLFVMQVRPWWKSLIGGAIASVLCYVIFAVLLSVRLPGGVLRPLLRALGLPA